MRRTMAMLCLLGSAAARAEAPAHGGTATPAQASSAVLQLCPAAQDAGARDGVLTHPDRRQLQVQLRAAGAALPSCASLALPGGLADVAAVQPLTPGQAGALGGTLLLHLDAAGERIVSVDSGNETAAPGRQAMPLQENLLPLLALRPYGVEERVSAVVEEGRLRLECRAGSKPAGLLLGGPWYLSFAAMQLRVSARAAAAGDAGFTLGVADAARAAREDAAAIGPLKGEAWFAMPARLDGASWRHFSIACPAQAAQLELSDLCWQPVPGKAAGRSAWVWQARQWQEEGDAVLAWAARHGLRALFLSVPLARDGAAADAAGNANGNANGSGPGPGGMAGGAPGAAAREARPGGGRLAVAQPERLAAFVRRATAQGIAVWPVDGDPRMVLDSERAATVARLRAYLAYNAAADASDRLRGVQFDVEHYLLPGYEREAETLDRAYLALLGALRREAGGLPLEFVVPFWWSGKEALLAGLAEHASGITVMDYRTDPVQIRRFAQPLLDWGVAHKKQVRIALEAGYLPPELQRRYARAEAGEAWLVQLEGVPLLLLLKTAQPNPHGPAFRFFSQRVLDGSATTFHADPAALLRMLPALEADFSAWPSFNGIALHELK